MTDLSTALDDLVAGIAAPPALAATVLRRRARRRSRLAAGVAVAAVAAGAATYGLWPGHRPESLGPAAPPPLAVVDGAPLSYLPPGFVDAGFDQFGDAPGLTGVFFGKVFRPASEPGQVANSLAVDVVRGPATLAAALQFARGSDPHDLQTADVTVRGHAGYRLTFKIYDSSPTYTTLVWVADPDLTLLVTAPVDLVPADQLRKVAEGIGDTELPTQPADPAAAEAAITQAYATAFGPGTRAHRLAAVQDGDVLAAEPPAKGEDRLGTAPAVSAISFASATRAYLHYASDPGVTANGVAVLAGGSWQVSAGTWCATVGLDPCP